MLTLHDPSERLKDLVDNGCLDLRLAWVVPIAIIWIRKGLTILN